MIADTKLKRKAKFPYLIFLEDQHTKDCPHREEVKNIVKGTSQLSLLTDPFPPQQ
jgi:hypothetical protein